MVPRPLFCFAWNSSTSRFPEVRLCGCREDEVQELRVLTVSSPPLPSTSLLHYSLVLVFIITSMYSLFTSASTTTCTSLLHLMLLLLFFFFVLLLLLLLHFFFLYTCCYYCCSSSSCWCWCCFYSSLNSSSSFLLTQYDDCALDRTLNLITYSSKQQRWYRQ